MRFVFIDHGAAEAAITACSREAASAAALAQSLRQAGGQIQDHWQCGSSDAFCAELQSILQELEGGLARLSRASGQLGAGLDQARADERRAEEEARREEEERRKRERERERERQAAAT